MQSLGFAVRHICCPANKSELNILFVKNIYGGEFTNM